MQNLFNRFVREEEGQDLVEYALLLGLIAVATVIMIGNLGQAVLLRFTAANTAVQP
jgi:Flp pilus assembly pilin Flp